MVNKVLILILIGNIIGLSYSNHDNSNVGKDISNGVQGFVFNSVKSGAENSQNYLDSDPDNNSEEALSPSNEEPEVVEAETPNNEGPSSLIQEELIPAQADNSGSDETNVQDEEEKEPKIIRKLIKSSKDKYTVKKEKDGLTQHLEKTKSNRKVQKLANKKSGKASFSEKNVNSIKTKLKDEEGPRLFNVKKKVSITERKKHSIDNDNVDSEGHKWKSGKQLLIRSLGKASYEDDSSSDEPQKYQIKSAGALAAEEKNTSDDEHEDKFVAGFASKRDKIIGNDEKNKVSGAAYYVKRKISPDALKINKKTILFAGKNKYDGNNQKNKFKAALHSILNEKIGDRLKNKISGLVYSIKNKNEEDKAKTQVSGISYDFKKKSDGDTDKIKLNSHLFSRQKKSDGDDRKKKITGVVYSVKARKSGGKGKARLTGVAYVLKEQKGNLPETLEYFYPYSNENLSADEPSDEENTEIDESPNEENSPSDESSDTENTEGDDIPNEEITPSDDATEEVNTPIDDSSNEEGQSPSDESTQTDDSHDQVDQHLINLADDEESKPHKVKIVKYIAL